MTLNGGRPCTTSSLPAGLVLLKISLLFLSVTLTQVWSLKVSLSVAIPDGAGCCTLLATAAGRVPSVTVDSTVSRSAAGKAGIGKDSTVAASSFGLSLFEAVGN